MVNKYESHCGDADLICKAYFNGFKDAIEKTSDKLYQKVLAPLVAGVYDNMWQTLPPETFSCGTFDAVFENANLLHRCNTDGAEEQVEIQPKFIYGLNLYPHEFEVVLVDDVDDPQQSALNSLLDTQGLCETEEQATWSDVINAWPGP